MTSSKEYNRYPLGSKWRKWDLQVQPIKNAWLKDPSKHLKEIQKATYDYMDVAVQKGIDVVAITDHNTGIAIDYAIGYNNVVVLPGVELDTPEGWHLLVLFNEEYKSQLKLDTWREVVDHFLSNIGGITPPYNSKKIKSTESILMEVSNRNIGIPIFAHCYSDDGFFKKGDRLGRMGLIDSYIKNQVEFLFEIKENHEQIEFINNTLKGWYPQQTPEVPIISSSDAHKASDVGKTFSWIKADPTFEGLRQVLYEPNDRIKVQQEKPESKNIYNVVKEVRFLDKSFSTDYIPISHNLTAIIGGKSTGKSVLLKNIAKAIDQEEFNKRNSSINVNESNPVSGFEVVWEDNQVSKLDSSSNPSKRIIYIPQSYLNRIVDDVEELTDIDKIIQDVLLQNEKFNNWYNSLQAKESEIALATDEQVKALFNDLRQLYLTKRDQKFMGDEEGIRKQIQKIKSEIESLSESGSMTSDEIISFNEKSEELKKSQNELELLNNDIFKLSDNKDLIIEFPDPNEFNFNKSKITAIISKLSHEFKESWSSAINELTKESQQSQKAGEEKVQKILNELKPLKKKMEGQKALHALFVLMESQNDKLNEIIRLKGLQKSTEESIINRIRKIAELNGEYFTIYLEAKNYATNKKNKHDLEFSIETVFSTRKFHETFIDKCLDGRKLRSAEWDYLTNYKFKSQEIHVKKWEQLISEIIFNPDFPITKGFNQEEIVQSIAKNWFSHDYRVKYQGDDLSEMSPGKKSFVLLRLLIDLDKSSCPILIDQPEDDLDNSSIYNDIVSFLRKSKKDRQILIVTHNPNLVLGADAELVVVANQTGNGTKNRKNKFEYVHGAIEHTIEEDNEIEEILYKRGVQEHICNIMEGGIDAFNKRKHKYKFNKKIK